MPENNFNIKGLSDEQVILAREKFGQNKLSYKKENGIVETLKNLAKEPMILLLLVASLIYFVSGKTGDGIFFPPRLYSFPLSHCFKIQEVEMLSKN